MIDKLQRFPNQLTEGLAEACGGEAVADILGNIAQVPLYAGFNYAAGLRVANTLPTTAGSNGYCDMLGGVVYGGIPTDQEPFNNESELYAANLANYPNRAVGLKFAARGLLQLNSYASICNYLDTQQQGVLMVMQWSESFLSPTNHILPLPKGGFTNHTVAVYGHDERGLQVKPWLGPDYGYCYLPEVMFPQVFYSAYGFSPTASRWWNLAYIGCTRPWLLNDILPQLTYAQ